MITEPEATLEKAPRKNGVVVLTELSPEFEAHYRKAREIEGRWYSDDIVRQLPNAKGKQVQESEWKLRVRSASNLQELLALSPEHNRVLDLGCGNGWFTAQLARLEGKKVWGVDLNQGELEQAARLFKAPNLEFVYADIFKHWPTHPTLDVITINSAVQYFSDLPVLVKHLMSLLRPGGELHIIDSPFYKAAQLDQAKKRTEEYYQQLGVPEMATTYHHHTLSELAPWNPMVLYNPKSIKNRLVRALGRNESPFPWVQLFKPYPEEA